MHMYHRQRDVPMVLAIPGGFIVRIWTLFIMLAKLCPYGANHNDHKIMIHTL